MSDIWENSDADYKLVLGNIEYIEPPLTERKLMYKPVREPVEEELLKWKNVKALLEQLQTHFDILSSNPIFPRFKKAFDCFYKFDFERTMKSIFAIKLREVKNFEHRLKYERTEILKTRNERRKYRKSLNEQRQMAIEDLAATEQKYTECVLLAETIDIVTLKNKSTRHLLELRDKNIFQKKLGNYVSIKRRFFAEKIKALDSEKDFFDNKAFVSNNFDSFAEEVLIKLRHLLNRAGIRNLMCLDNQTVNELKEIFLLASDKEHMTTYVGYLDKRSADNLKEKIKIWLCKLFEREMKRFPGPTIDKSSKLSNKSKEKNHIYDKVKHGFQNHNFFELLEERINYYRKNLNYLPLYIKNITKTINNFKDRYWTQDVIDHKEQEDLLLYRISELNEQVFEKIFNDLKQKNSLFSIIPSICFCSKFKLSKALSIFSTLEEITKKPEKDVYLLKNKQQQLKRLVAALQFNFMFKLIWRESGTHFSGFESSRSIFYEDSCALETFRSKMSSGESFIKLQTDSSFISSEGEINDLYVDNKILKSHQKTSSNIVSRSEPQHILKPLDSKNKIFSEIKPKVLFTIAHLSDEDLSTLSQILENLLPKPRVHTEPALDNLRKAKKFSISPERTLKNSRQSYISNYKFQDVMKSLTQSAMIYIKAKTKKSSVAFNPFTMKQEKLVRCGFSPFLCRLSLVNQDFLFTPTDSNGSSKKTLPLKFIRKLVIPNNTKDFIIHIQKEKMEKKFIEERLFELVIFCFSSDYFQVVVPSFSLFNDLVCFIECCLTDPYCIYFGN